MVTAVDNNKNELSLQATLQPREFRGDYQIYKMTSQFSPWIHFILFI